MHQFGQKRAVREAEIVGLPLGLAEVGHGIGDLAALLHLPDVRRATLAHRPAPAEPEPAPLLSKRLAQGDRQAAGHRPFHWRSGTVTRLETTTRRIGFAVLRSTGRPHFDTGGRNRTLPAQRNVSVGRTGSQVAKPCGRRAVKSAMAMVGFRQIESRIVASSRASAGSVGSMQGSIFRMSDSWLRRPLFCLPSSRKQIRTMTDLDRTRYLPQRLHAIASPDQARRSHLFLDFDGTLWWKSRPRRRR
jgi:hypothetical protein